MNVLRARGLKRFILIKSENQYHNALSSAFIDAVDETQSVRVLHNFNPSEMDFRAVFPVLRRANYDAVGVYIVAAGHHAFFSQAKAAGIHFKNLFGTNGFESVPLNIGVEDAVDGALFANTSVDSAFRERYQQRFGDVNQLVDGALAYEFVMLVKDLFLNKQPPSSSEELLSRFEISGKRSGVCGEYVFKNTPASGKYFSFPTTVGEMKNGHPNIPTVGIKPKVQTDPGVD